MNPIKILIVDDHAILRMGLASLLNAKPDFKVIGEADNGAEGIAAVRSLAPDVVIMDLMMPKVDGIEATRQIKASGSAAKILILTTFSTSDSIARALATEADGAIMKNCDFGELTAAIRTIAGGEQYLSSEVQRILKADPPVATLSPRQAEILQSIIRGLSNPDIAKQLGISVDMVKEHVVSLFKKIGAANRTEAVAIALRKHLLKL